MKRIASSSMLVAAFAACSLIASAESQRKPPAHFSLTVGSTSGEIVLACDDGCTWKSLRFDATRTPVLFDEQGLLPQPPGKAARADAFTISASTIGNRLELKCISGCSWRVVVTKLSVVRLDENGPIRTSQAVENRASQFPSLWSWPKVGGTVRVRIIEGERIDAENVMTPDPAERYSAGTSPFAPFGGIESAHLTKMGTTYAGRYQSAQVCFYSDSEFTESRHNCRFQTAIEITLLTPTRIEGRAESDFAFDCRSCTMTGKPRMKPFVWTPVK